jgi:lipid-A-disaccharide synthase
MRVLISAGEASGDHYGAELVRALRRQITEQFDVSGLGGAEMRATGCDTVVDAHEIAVVGITEVLSSLPRIRVAFRRLIAEAERRRPDVAVLIDFPDFNLRLAKQLHRRGIPVIYFVSPQVWAWRSGRVKQIRQYVRKMLVIFPFEVEWFRDRGVEAEYVGHPLADERPQIPSREEFAIANNLNPQKQWIALLPGSRRKEFDLNLTPMLKAAARLSFRGNAASAGSDLEEFQFVLPIAPTLARNQVQENVASCFRPVGRVAPFTLRLVENANAALAHARAAVVASGTATVQAALAGAPFIMVYRVARSSYLLGRWMVRVPHFAMPNLIAGRRIVPELVQRDFTAENVARELRKIIPEGPARKQMLADLAEVRAMLRTRQASGREPVAAVDRAAAAVLRVVEEVGQPVGQPAS